MAQAHSIWTPVVVGRLKEPLNIKSQKIYDLEKRYKSRDDLRIKVKSYRVVDYGQSLEAWLRVDILCLVEDLAGNIQLIAKEETIRERIKISAFDRLPDKDSQLKYVINVLQANAYGELEGLTLKVGIFIDLTIIATAEMLVSLSLVEQPHNQQDLSTEVLTKLKLELQAKEAEKDELKQKLFFYEHEVKNLKRGLNKAENKNAGLNKELGHFRLIVEELQTAIKEKEWRLNRYENTFYNQSYGEKVKEEEIGNLGSRIKRMFASS